MNKAIATSESNNLDKRLYLNKNLMSFFVGLILCSFRKCHNRRVAKTVFILLFLPQRLQLNLPKVSRRTDHKNANIIIYLSFLHTYYTIWERESQSSICTNFSIPRPVHLVTMHNAPGRHPAPYQRVLLSDTKYFAPYSFNTFFTVMLSFCVAQ